MTGTQTTKPKPQKAEEKSAHSLKGTPSVAQDGSLLFREFPTHWGALNSKCDGLAFIRRVQSGNNADWNGVQWKGAVVLHDTDIPNA